MSLGLEPRLARMELAIEVTVRLFSIYYVLAVTLRMRMPGGRHAPFQPCPAHVAASCHLRQIFIPISHHEVESRDPRISSLCHFDRKISLR